MPNTSGGGFWASLFKQIPFSKLRRYEVTNLLFEAMALYFTLQYTKNPHDQPIIALSMWAGVLVLGAVCVFWACKQ
ncbi:MAG: hypothetical protein JST28_03740 [Acidobacteria bacterium]|nr:hypothetical protein [Acidobacteriota bacterium]